MCTDFKKNSLLTKSYKKTFDIFDTEFSIL